MNIVFVYKKNSIHNNIGKCCRSIYMHNISKLHACMVSMQRVMYVQVRIDSFDAVSEEFKQSTASLTLGAHAQRGLQ